MVFFGRKKIPGFLDFLPLLHIRYLTRDRNVRIQEATRKINEAEGPEESMQRCVIKGFMLKSLRMFWKAC